VTDSSDPARDLLRALHWLDRRLDRAVAAMRQAHGPEAAADPYRGLYVSHEDAGRLAGRAPGAGESFAAAEEEGLDADPGTDGGRLDRLCRAAGLSALDRALLVLALAPELDLKYERVFAYLQDDVTRKRPTVDLALQLFCPGWEARAAGRARLAAGAPLLRHRLLHLADDPAHRDPPLLARYLRPDPRVVEHLLGYDQPDAALLPYVRVAEPEAELSGLLLDDALKAGLAALARAPHPGTLVHLRGDYGVGRRTAAEALCREAGVRLLAADAAAMLAAGADAFPALAGAVAREALLRGAAVLWEGWDALLTDDRAPQRARVLRDAADAPLTFLSGAGAWDPGEAAGDVPLVRVELPRPGYAARVQLWGALLNGDGEGVDVDDLANRFRLSGGQIRDALAAARVRARVGGPAAGPLTTAELSAACRAQSTRRLAELARKVTPRYGWDDIVLPEDRREQLREIVNAMRYRSLVLHRWGFDGKLAMGKGLNVLFAGPPGTGKTMAAEIVAGALGLDLYRIDLASMVSKYIGETEKNLSRIFAEAESSNAVLFFDEADAMFGKRTEVRDSHDRYANLEVSYLLQRMEEYEGVVVLASNFRKNMDEAFVRRMHFTIDFPFPSERERLRIWEGVWPEALPRDPDLPLAALARRVEVAGGNIRNIALAAAFLAAEDGGVVTAAHLVRATRREYQKMGKVVSEAELAGFAVK
jgi:hypothetical protein